MRAIKNRNIILLKGMLFLLTGIVSSIIILIEHPNLKMLLLLILAVWSFARFYYFLFYVIEHYVDNSYKFSGLCSFILYVFRQNRK